MTVGIKTLALGQKDSVGKKFDNVYPKVCKRFRKKKDFEFRKRFKLRIDPHNMSKISWLTSTEPQNK